MFILFQRLFYVYKEPKKYSKQYTNFSKATERNIIKSTDLAAYNEKMSEKKFKTKITKRKRKENNPLVKEKQEQDKLVNSTEKR
jgi:hypothetical protein